MWNEFEAGDPRREATIINPTDEEIENPAQEIYLGSRFMNKKYAMQDNAGNYIALTHPTRGPLNFKVIRYADVLLMYAEACVELNKLSEARAALETVRNRARNGNAGILPAFLISDKLLFGSLFSTFNVSIVKVLYIF